MHLVSVETVADALRFLATVGRPLDRNIFLLTDDDCPENNFGWMQDALSEAFGRPRMIMLPHLPPRLLQVFLRLRGAGYLDPMRRFMGRRLAEFGFVPEVEFKERLRAFAVALASRAPSS